MAKSKLPQTTVGDRGQATAPLPAVTLGGGATRSKYSTFFTKVPVSGTQTATIYEGDRLWVDVTLVLETAGPVAVSDMATVTPVLSGKGLLLPTGVPLTFRVAKSNKLYIASTAVNRVKVMIQPVPWLEQITGVLLQLAGRMLGRIPGVTP